MYDCLHHNCRFLLRIASKKDSPTLSPRYLYPFLLLPFFLIDCCLTKDATLWFRYLYNTSSFRTENSSTAQVSLGSPRYLLGRIRRAGGVYGNCGSCSLIISDVIYLDHGWLCGRWRVTTCTPMWTSCTPPC